MAEITAAVGWVVSPVIKMVIEKIKTFIEKKYFERSSIVDDMTKMNTTLPEILSTMTTVEKYRIVDPYQVQLVRQIKDAVYDAEDCIDDFDYKLAKEEYEKSLPNKVRRVTASCSRFIHQTIVGNSSFKKKLTRVNERPISLDALNDDDGWSLLKLKAFDCVNPDNLHDLEPIGRKIVNKLKGLPLAIRVVGPRLRGKFDMEEWKRILKDDSLDNDIIEVLHRSYEHLPGHLQRCFAYCSLFPKDYYLKRVRLVHMWIAHGFVFPKEGERLEDVGKSYFNELIARSFIQVIERNNKEYYVVHDLMNDLACHVS
ncbi:NBS-LRR disease resistance protein [Rhynchospora pubera]|uniref:NBS-LRR disease resistance protein n=1 Tax=Rhynchospora pubera TaxID=906938 RepID=A0AAV8C822_9POAL|nr:NBS-LRR disease resistance protein [Rhynchospora pubera]